MHLSAVDKKILNRLQSGFPLVSKPFQALGEELGLSEADVIQSIKALKDKGVVRSVCASFDSRKLGYKSTLVAMAVPGKALSKTVRVINSYNEVTHNYLRENKKTGYNLWFTVIAGSETKLGRIIREIKRKTGINKALNMPAERFFKLNLKFEF